MGSSFSKTETIKARKAYQCAACKRPIPAGSAYTSWRGVWEGDFFSFKLHTPCNDFCADVDDGDGVDVHGCHISEVAKWASGQKPLAKESILSYFQAIGDDTWLEYLTQEGS